MSLLLRQRACLGAVVRLSLARCCPPGNPHRQLYGVEVVSGSESQDYAQGESQDVPERLHAAARRAVAHRAGDILRRRSGLGCQRRFVSLRSLGFEHNFGFALRLPDRLRFWLRSRFRLWHRLRNGSGGEGRRGVGPGCCGRVRSISGFRRDGLGCSGGACVGGYRIVRFERNGGECVKRSVDLGSEGRVGDKLERRICVSGETEGAQVLEMQVLT